MACVNCANRLVGNQTKAFGAALFIPDRLGAAEIGRAMRAERIDDPQGRSVRAKHAAREGQLFLWDDIRTASRKHMDIAFKQRRQQIVGDCHQLKTDVDSFNENRSPFVPIQMSFDFTNDLLEEEALEEKEAG